MSFKYIEGAGYARQTFNPEEISDGRPRVVTFTRVKKEERKEKEGDRENPQSIRVEGQEEEEEEIVEVERVNPHSIRVEGQEEEEEMVEVDRVNPQFCRVERQEEEEEVVVEVVRENPQFCRLEGLEEGEEKTIFIRMLADLQSESLVLLGEHQMLLSRIRVLPRKKLNTIFSMKKN